MIQVLARRSTDGVMAKKKATEPVKFNPRAAGLQILKANAVRQMVAACRCELADMDVALDTLHEHNLTEAEVEGATKLARALELLMTFTENLERAVKKEIRKLRSA